MSENLPLKPQSESEQKADSSNTNLWGKWAVPVAVTGVIAGLVIALLSGAFISYAKIQTNERELVSLKGQNKKLERSLLQLEAARTKNLNAELHLIYRRLCDSTGGKPEDAQLEGTGSMRVLCKDNDRLIFEASLRF
ncbi:MAG: hypothetical protein AAGD38_21370 [Acidobacteriota bacterium]